MTHTIQVNAVVLRPDPGGLERRLITASFEIPMTGDVYGWHMDHNGPHQLQATTFEFKAPNLEQMLIDQRNIGKGEALSELAAMPLTEAVQILATIAESNQTPNP